MRKAIIILCTLLIFAVTGCINNKSNIISVNNDNDNGNPPSTTATTIPLVTSEPVNISSVAESQGANVSKQDSVKIASINGIISDYNVVKTNFEKNSKNINIIFPQINGLTDITKQVKINNLLRNAALVGTQDDLSVYRSFNLDYTIMCTSNNLLSIKFYGYYDIIIAPHPNNIDNTVNIDMKTGNIIKLPDIINPNSEFIQLFINKSQFVSAATINFEAIKKDYFNINNLKYSFEKDAEFYFTSTSIVFSVSTNHAIGDYALYSLNFSDISKYIIQEGLWDDIKSDFPSTSFQIIRDQCFKTTLNGFGSTWFISGFDKSSNGILESLKFYLIDNNGNVKYIFPDFSCSSLGYYGIRAVSFNDVNRDGNDDVIIIAALNKNQYPELDEAKVYLGYNEYFILDNKFNTYLNSTLRDTKIVSDVLDTAKNYFK